VEMSQTSRSGYRRALYRDFPFRCSSYFNNLLADDDVAGVVLTMRDISVRRTLEAKLNHTRPSMIPSRAW